LQRFTPEMGFRFAIYSREHLAQKIYNLTGGKHSKYLFVESAAGLGNTNKKIFFFFFYSSKKKGISHGYSPLFTLLDLVFMNDERCYPHSVYQYFLIDTPWLFSFFKLILTPFVNSEPLSKVKTHGNGYFEELCKYVEESEIPQEMYGKCECKDARCLTPIEQDNLLSIIDNILKEREEENKEEKAEGNKEEKEEENKEEKEEENKEEKDNE
jgi:hypothetical protein